MSWPALHPRRPPGQVIALADHVDAAAIQALIEQADRAAHAGARRVMIDLTAVSHIDNKALSELCGALRRLSGRGGLAVLGADARVRWVLELCQIDGVELHSAARERHQSARSAEPTAATRRQTPSPAATPTPEPSGTRLPS